MRIDSTVVVSPGSATGSAAIGLLLLRLFAGIALAFAHGLGKVPPSEGFISTVGEIGFPMPALFAWAAGLSEFVGGIFMAIGLLTRPASLFVAITMLSAAFVRHADDPFRAQEKALLFAVIAIALMLTGAGRYSIDAALSRRLAE